MLEIKLTKLFTVSTSKERFFFLWKKSFKIIRKKKWPAENHCGDYISRTAATAPLPRPSLSYPLLFIRLFLFSVYFSNVCVCVCAWIKPTTLIARRSVSSHLHVGLFGHCVRVQHKASWIKIIYLGTLVITIFLLLLDILLSPIYVLVWKVSFSSEN